MKRISMLRGVLLSAAVIISSISGNLAVLSGTASAAWAGCTKRGGNLKLDTQVVWNSYHGKYETRIWATREWVENHIGPVNAYWGLIELKVDGQYRNMGWNGSYNYILEYPYKSHTVFAKWQQSLIFTAPQYLTCSVTTQ